MNETKWLSGADGDAMLDHAGDRLTPRQWVFVAAAYARRVWDLLPPGPARDAVDFAETADQPIPDATRAEWLTKIDAATPAAVGAAELAQREIVKLCDPDAADVRDPLLNRPNQVAPAFPLFHAASRHARLAIEAIGEAAGVAARAVRALFSDPSEELLNQVRARVEEAVATRTRANQSANLALRCKQEGDELADRAAGAKNKRLEESKAEEMVRRFEEAAGQRENDFEAEEKRDRAARKHLARLLREVVGNPFKEPRFDPAWRTGTVAALARGIFAERAFDRLPILADALLDADCDEEAILRHCRGTEVGVKDPPQHVRGCWVVELVLGRWTPLPPPAPGAKPRRRRVDFDDLDIGLPFDDRGRA